MMIAEVEAPTTPRTPILPEQMTEVELLEGEAAKAKNGESARRCQPNGAACRMFSGVCVVGGTWFARASTRLRKLQVWEPGRAWSLTSCR